MRANGFWTQLAFDPNSVSWKLSSIYLECLRADTLRTVALLKVPPPETAGACRTGRQSMGSGPPGLPQLPKRSSTTTWLHGLWRPAPGTFPTQALLAALPLVQKMDSRQLRWISRCWVTLLSFSSTAGSPSFSHSFSGLWIPGDEVGLSTPAHATL